MNVAPRWSGCTWKSTCTAASPSSRPCGQEARQPLTIWPLGCPTINRPCAGCYSDPETCKHIIKCKLYISYDRQRQRHLGEKSTSLSELGRSGNAPGITKFIVVITLQHIHLSNYYVAHFKLIPCYISTISQQNWEGKKEMLCRRLIF